MRPVGLPGVDAPVEPDSTREVTMAHRHAFNALYPADLPTLTELGVSRL